MQITTADDLRARLEGVATITPTGVEVTDEGRLRGELIDELVFEAVFNADAGLRDAARWVIWSASQALGCGSASIHELYRARGRGEIDPRSFTVAAINVRAATYLTARQAFAAAARAGRGDGHLRDRQERDGVHGPASRRVHRGRAGRRHPRGLADAGLPAGRPLPVQRDEVGERSAERAERPQGPHSRGDRCRLPEHRHRQLDPRRPLAALGDRAAAGERREHCRADRPRSGPASRMG